MASKKKEEVEEVYQPMAVPEPTIEDQMIALKLRVDELESITQKHQRYHFGGVAKG